MKFHLFVFSALLALSNPAFGDTKDQCTCDHSCQEACAKGDSKDCACKACDCKHGKCEHGKCEHPEHQKKAEKKK